MPAPDLFEHTYGPHLHHRIVGRARPQRRPSARRAGSRRCAPRPRRGARPRRHGRRARRRRRAHRRSREHWPDAGARGGGQRVGRLRRGDPQRRGRLQGEASRRDGGRPVPRLRRQHARAFYPHRADAATEAPHLRQLGAAPARRRLARRPHVGAKAMARQSGLLRHQAARRDAGDGGGTALAGRAVERDRAGLGWRPR